jgi:hypothetical protein
VKHGRGFFRIAKTSRETSSQFLFGSPPRRDSRTGALISSGMNNGRFSPNRKALRRRGVGAEKKESLFPPGLNNKTELGKTVDKHEQLTLKSYFAVPPKANIKVFELSFDIYPIPRSFIFQVSE